MNILNNIAPQATKLFNYSNYITIQNDMIGLSKLGTIDYLCEDMLIPLFIKTHCKIITIATGGDFVLAISDRKELFYIKLNGIKYYVFFLGNDVVNVFAGFKQFYFETEDEFCGSERVIVPILLAICNEDLAFNRIWAQITRKYKNKYKLIRTLSAGSGHVCAIIENTKHGNPIVSLVTWGSNQSYQCGNGTTKSIPFSTLKPFNVSKANKHIAAPVAVGCTSDATCFITINNECYVIGKIGCGRPQKIALDITDPWNVFCSFQTDAMLISRRGGGAVAIGSSPFGNLGLRYTRNKSDFYHPVQLMKHQLLKNAWMGKYLTFIEAEAGPIEPLTASRFKEKKFSAYNLTIIAFDKPQDFTPIYQAKKRSYRDVYDRNERPQKLFKYVI
jgi:hypothetical protein